MGLAQRFGLVELDGRWADLGSTGALVALGVLFTADLVGDKVPALDSVLHVVGIAVAPVSGAVVAGAQANLLEGVDPPVAMAVGAVVGGGTQVLRLVVRPVVTATTGGVGNPVVSFVEDGLSLAMFVLALVVPVLAVVTFVVGATWLWQRWRRRRRGRRALPA